MSGGVRDDLGEMVIETVLGRMKGRPQASKSLRWEYPARIVLQIVLGPRRMTWRSQPFERKVRGGGEKFRYEGNV